MRGLSAVAQDIKEKKNLVPTGPLAIDPFFFFLFLNFQTVGTLGCLVAHMHKTGVRCITRAEGRVSGKEKEEATQGAVSWLVLACSLELDKRLVDWRKEGHRLGLPSVNNVTPPPPPRAKTTNTVCLHPVFTTVALLLTFPCSVSHTCWRADCDG